MAVKLRLKRMGAKKRPFYRIVASDSRSPRDGRFIEIVGTYNPINKENEITLNEEKVLKWLGNGAVPTDTVKSILVKNGVMKKHNASKVKKVKKVAPKAEAKVSEKKTAPKTVKKATTTKKAPAKKTTKKEGK